MWSRDRNSSCLGIMEINPEGKSEVMRQLEAEKKLPAPVEGEVSGGQTQEQVDRGVERIVGGYKSVFEGIGRAKVKPIQQPCNHGQEVEQHPD